jgi:hypothetical protein
MKNFEGVKLKEDERIVTSLKEGWDESTREI